MISRGFTLVETLLGVFIFSLVVLGIYQGFYAASQAVMLSRIKTEAALLATEQFEFIRNLPYQSVGLTNGLPAGVLPRTQSLARGGINFNLTTTIRNTDDPFDGTIGGVPNDTAPADYKNVTLTIDCTGCVLSSPLSFSVTVAPKNLENSTGNGALFLHVIDAYNLPVPQAQVHVEKLSSGSLIIIDETTDNDGRLQLVDVPPGANNYMVAATKSGYSSDGTLVPSLSNPNPSQPPLTVVAGTVTQKTLAIDRLSNLNFSTFATSCAPLGNISFNLRGDKLLGNNPIIYKYDHSFTTSAAGELAVNNLEWDNYDFQLSGTTYDLAGITSDLPISLEPNVNKNVAVVLAPHWPRALLVMVGDSVSGLPLSAATTTLWRSGNQVGQQVTGNAGACGPTGQAFFSGLSSGTYRVVVERDGYQVYDNPAVAMTADWQKISVPLQAY